jgi:hypothetical protein
MDINGLVSLVWWAIIFLVAHVIGKHSAYAEIFTIYGSKTDHSGTFKRNGNTYYVLDYDEYQRYRKCLTRLYEEK